MSLEKDGSLPSTLDILKISSSKALSGGIPGALAMVIQVCTLMPLRTTFNYQYRHGGSSTVTTFRVLYNEGGLRRFYRGVAPALLMGPLCRFGDTAANVGVLSLLDSFKSTEGFPIALKTMAASTTAALWRINLTPIDTLKTTLQVQGPKGLSLLGEKIKMRGPSILYHGALASASATFVGHFPWFFTHNQLSSLISKPADDRFFLKLSRNALIGFISSMVSDTCSNSIRVVKTTKQTHEQPITYPQAVSMVICKDGVTGLLFRGLRTKILANGVQVSCYQYISSHYI
ncbi:uncharacterized protein LOC135146208 isoform X1 [Zophobas morio]|uniref:uncharacterized protein LOC135146208 isoform X1 n=1 Tax=Zophobas morio TaxID=2755281 RepID=UPI0030836325